MRVEKQNIVRLEMEKQQLMKDLTELKEELLKVKANEKKLKNEVNEEKLKNSKALQDALRNTVAQGTMPPQASALGYQGYLARQRMTGGTGLITGKIGMQSKFMDYGKLNTNEGTQNNPIA